MKGVCYFEVLFMGSKLVVEVKKMVYFFGGDVGLVVEMDLLLVLVLEMCFYIGILW